MMDLSKTLSENDVKYQLHSQTNPQDHEMRGPFTIVRGEGPVVFDADGKAYLDTMAGLWCASLGFENARIAGVAESAYRSLSYYHSFGGRTSPSAVDAAAAIADLVPIKDARIHFATSGSEAVETMIKLAWLHFRARGETARRKIIARDRAFHGSTIFAASLTGLAHMHREFGLPLEGIVRVSCPDPYRGKIEGEGDADFVARLAAELEGAILREGPETIAAFIAEPVSAGAGIIVPPEGYFPAIQSILRKYGILFLADEIVCGFGRTGQWFGSQTLDIEPDMMAMAKGLSSSYFPISAVALSPGIYEAIKEANGQGTNFGHGFTNSGHPVGTAIVREVLAIYSEMNVLSRVHQLGDQLLSRLRQELAGNEIVGDIRGIGLMAGVEIVRSRRSREPFAPEKDAMAQIERMARDRHLILRPQGNTITFCPPFVISEQHIEEIVETMGGVLREIEARLLVS